MNESDSGQSEPGYIGFNGTRDELVSVARCYTSLNFCLIGYFGGVVCSIVAVGLGLSVGVPLGLLIMSFACGCLALVFLMLLSVKVDGSLLRAVFWALIPAAVLLGSAVLSYQPVARSVIEWTRVEVPQDRLPLVQSIWSLVWAFVGFAALWRTCSGTEDVLVWNGVKIGILGADVSTIRPLGNSADS